jgi:hypothetical protein
MLESRLKSIERKTMDEEVKNNQLQIIQQREKKHKTKQTFTYSATIVLFLAMLFIFMNTINTNLPNHIEQSSTSFEFGELKKATYLFSQQPEKNYDLTSPFYIEKLTTTNSEKLQEFQQIFSEVTLKPFTRSLKEFPNATNYLFESKNGEMIYLKSLEDDDRIIIIEPSTMMEVELSAESANTFAMKWAAIYAETNQFPKWKIVVIIISILTAIIYEVIYRSKKPKRKNSIIVNLILVSMMYTVIHVGVNWIGTIHELFLIFAFSIFFIVWELLYVLLKLKPFNWKELTVSLVGVNGVLIILCL